jgi:hypothetical protein
LVESRAVPRAYPRSPAGGAATRNVAGQRHRACRCSPPLRRRERRFESPRGTMLDLGVSLSVTAMNNL